MLRITRHDDGGRVRLEVEGRLTSQEAGVLEAEFERTPAGAAVDVDLGGVTYVDGAGLNLIKRLQQRRARLVNCPELIRDLLSDD